ncbi:hypothetical protein MTO96_046464 [Rhipicephalus appendiculatus]
MDSSKDQEAAPKRRAVAASDSPQKNDQKAHRGHIRCSLCSPRDGPMPTRLFDVSRRILFLDDPKSEEASAGQAPTTAQSLNQEPQERRSETPTESPSKKAKSTHVCCGAAATERSELRASGTNHQACRRTG